MKVDDHAGSGPRSPRPSGHQGGDRDDVLFGHDVSGWGWFAMSAGMIAFWALIIAAAAVLLLRNLSRAAEPTPSPAAPSPEQPLAEWFARGDIDEEDYRRRLHAPQATGPHNIP
ncbi:MULTISPECIES: SHOCT domain-containing protein [Streptomyces]|uniref:SHOCT domain-containing protein n=2 Tax=Streptomyces TaxID=1883 RepID=A0ABU4KFA4_9ACTN|nr:SHOCT domain-containing protein [Streptomyces roseolus]MDX2296441.1 SHOCT domain-containing protein [Streptomyces roseolus]